MDRKLKRLLIYYAVSAFFATAIISGAVVSESYIMSLSNTLNQFRTLRVNSVKMTMATKRMDELSVKVAALMPPDCRLEEMEGAVLKTVDAIQTRMKGADIRLANFERKDNEIALPLLITGALDEYNLFVRDIGYLQSLTSPFMHVGSVSISKSPDENRECVVYEIRGSLKMQSFRSGGKS